MEPTRADQTPDDGSDGPTLGGAAVRTTIRLGEPGIGEALGVLAASLPFRAFEQEDLDAIVHQTAARGRLHLARYPDGALIVREGDPAEHLLVLRAGHAQVFKRTAGGAEFEVNRLAAGECLGELALIDPAPRSASVRAIGPVDVLAVPIAELLELTIDRPSVAVGLLGMARAVAHRLRQSTDVMVRTLEQALEEQRTRSAMGRFTMLLILAYSLYSWVLGTAAQVKQSLGRSELVSVPVVLVTVGFVLAFMRGSGYPASFFGLSRERAGRHVLEALAFTLPWLLAVVLLKMLLIAHVPAMHGVPLFEMGSPAPGGGARAFNPWLVLAYLVLVPFQELICRGALQSALTHFLVGRWRVPLAVIGSNTVFSAAHLYVSPGLSVSAFVAGLFWGWLYHRQGTLVGVTASHLVLGFFAFEVVDLGVLE